MLDSYCRPIIDPILKQIARGLARIGLNGYSMTLGGLCLGLLACLCAFYQVYYAAFFFLLLNRMADGLDGAIAREKGESSDFGGYLDILCDYIIYAGLPLVMAWGLNIIEAYQAASFVIFTMVMSAVSFLAYAIIAEKRGMETVAQGEKSFYFSKGLMEGTETILFLCFLCLIPHYFGLICFIFGGLCLLTALLRLYMAYYLLR